MIKEVKRYFTDCNRLRSGDKARDECDVRVVLATDYDALLCERDVLTMENGQIWETFVKVADRLGIDPKEAMKAPGKPSDVFIAKINELEKTNDQ